MILVIGRTGQLATELGRRPGTRCLGRTEADLTDPEGCADAIRRAAPAAVINAAAWTAVDAAEEDEFGAHLANARAPAAMARACAGLGIPFVQVSTDYVFAGSGDAPHAPDASTAPLSAYGRTKLAGEAAVRAAGGPHAVLRTSWVVSAHGSNFVKTMLRLGRDRGSLRIVADQVGGPTPARDLAAACATIAQALVDAPDQSGTYHYAGAPDISWAGFARAIFETAGLACTVTDIPTADYPTPAPRPLNSRLDCRTIEAAFGLARPDWRAGLRDILHDLGEIP
ncbi:dTDP-4-dehydrorhamnose reductase [Jannaschia ovalis]|uniref:dTDP-4-dehydrorhamnose reductase n=1 Tax=Jannaschia ovalis TaxID=3038773 RepID=A0ABY8LAT9_9RHOB|nr:dTDP-4-dehydrorhamnose reductase [Jannaschia sp. GRR-S6-38]WGH77293.1 dTDP-4-dehydrorhamnose reductase [Jannaschia sp. GRR-S6-38]